MRSSNRGDLTRRTGPNWCGSFTAVNRGRSSSSSTFIERITDEQSTYLKTLPLGLICPNGVLCIHAGPSRKATGPKDLTPSKRSGRAATGMVPAG